MTTLNNIFKGTFMVLGGVLFATVGLALGALGLIAGLGLGGCAERVQAGNWAKQAEWVVDSYDGPKWDKL